MAGVKSPASRWCFLRDDFRIKAAISSQMKADNVSLGAIQRDLGIDKAKVSRYLNHQHSTYKWASITQHQLMQICLYLKIYITPNIEISND